jgi:hypothetical protein
MGVNAFTAFGSGLREIFTLRAAERVSSAYGEDQLRAIRAEKSEARARLRASRRLASPTAALLLLRDAQAHALAAVNIAGNHAASSIAIAEVDAQALTFAEAETLRDRADAVVRGLLGGVESRSKNELRGLRIGRALAVVLLIAGIVWHFARTRWLVHDVALHKPVITSPLRPPPFTAEGVTDGRTRGTFAVQTLDGKPGFVMVDLERSYDIQRVKVWNRGDGWFYDNLPLTLDVSDDGVKFHEVAKRTEYFEVWMVDLGGRAARFVRVSKENGYVALNEIEVYARE